MKFTKNRVFLCFWLQNPYPIPMGLAILAILAKPMRILRRFWPVLTVKTPLFDQNGLFRDFSKTAKTAKSIGKTRDHFRKSNNSSKNTVGHVFSPQLESILPISQSDHFYLGPLGHFWMNCRFVWRTKWQTQWTQFPRPREPPRPKPSCGTTRTSAGPPPGPLLWHHQDLCLATRTSVWPNTVVF